MNHRILIVEDDKILSDGLKQAMEEEGHEVLIAMDGETGLYMAQTTQPDLLILDIMMPHLNGFEVITELRRGGDNVPVIVLSARTDSKDKVRGLDLGADDYVSKPFDLDELLARVRRHFGRRTANDQIFGSLIYEWKTRQLLSGTERHQVTLTAKERKLLEFFLKREGQIVSREQVLDGVWGDYDGTDRTVDNLIVSLRKKVGSEYLLTERGLGYRFVTKP
jgi:two-component system response regulator MprA